MFDKFGEFDSSDEINRAAAAQRREGDYEAILAIAEENGIDPEDAQDFIDGNVTALVTPLTAAFGKLEMAEAVRRRGKSLKGCIAALLTWSFKNQRPVPKEIAKAAGISFRVTLGIPGMGKAKQIITDYYMGGQ